jgi:ATP-dependent DNA helicase PIF1
MAGNAFKLTEDQLKVVRLAENGHNICIIGKAGVGKTTVVREIMKKISSQRRNCYVICASGVSCESYNGVAKTVHSQYGLYTGELPGKLLVERALDRNNIVDCIKNTDVLIWDEISMSSARIFELVNMLHHMISKNDLPFGGIQVLLVGDFLQLKPIRTFFDRGHPIFHSKLFDEAFSHRVELKQVKRQYESEFQLKRALDQVRIGECTDDTEAYFNTLNRECKPSDGSEDVVHIYFRKLSVEVHNIDVLSSLPGDLIVLQSSDTGSAKYLERSVSSVIPLKPGCNVMLLYNISNKLRNGSRGKFIELQGAKHGEDQRVIVRFPTVGTVSLERRTWFKYDKNGVVQGSRTQFPLTPCYAITAHKAQSLTLNAAVVHCAQEFVSGQTYVALSRVKEEAALQVIGFQRKLLLPVPTELLSLVEDQCDPDPTLHCCRNNHLDESFFQCIEDEGSEDEGDEISEQVADEESPAEKFFETNDGIPVNLENVLLACLCDFESHLSVLPQNFSIKDFLESIVKDNHDDPFSKSIKSAAQFGIDNLGTFEVLVRILWCRVHRLFRDYLSENGEEVHMTNRDFTTCTAKLHELFLTQEYRSDLISSFGASCWSEINNGQRTLGFKLVFHIFELFSEELGNLVRRKEEDEPLPFKVDEMGAHGRGKVRYVGAWAIRKSIQKSRRYIEFDCSDDASL